MSDATAPTFPPFIWHATNTADATAGKWLNLEPDIVSHCICTDTRKIKTGDIFLAIKGDNFDGHRYLDKAAEMGAVAAIVSEKQATNIPQLIVKDTKLALGNLGRYVRAQHKNLKVIALTGSSGKTTTKEMLGSILNQLAPTLITRGNLNNDLGVPMMLLELSEQHRYAVLELGANHVGEIAYTAAMVKPHVACVLNIGTAHLGEFGGRDNICKAKSEIFSALTTKNVAVIPAHDDYASMLTTAAQSYTKHITAFAKDINATDCHLHATGSRFTLNIGQEAQPITLAFAGEHNITNALAAAACAHSLGVNISQIAQGLSNAHAPKGRLNHSTYKNHTIIDDTYNANPDAVLAAADVLLKTAEEKPKKTTTVMVLGDIGELGDAGETQHHALGNKLALKGVDTLYCVGDLMQHCVLAAQSAGLHAVHFKDKSALAAQLKEHMHQQDLVILFKGSRFMAIETIIADICV